MGATSELDGYINRSDHWPAVMTELRAILSSDPGRQREYNLFFSGARKSETRRARVEKYVANILGGSGMRHR